MSKDSSSEGNQLARFDVSLVIVGSAVALGTAFYLMAIMVVISTPFSDIYAAMIDHASQYYHPLGKTKMVFSIVGIVFLFLMCSLTSVLFIRKKRTFPITLTILLVLNLAYWIAIYYLTVIVPGYDEQKITYLIIICTLVSIVLIPYLFLYPRVKRVFIYKISERTPRGGSRFLNQPLQPGLPRLSRGYYFAGLFFFLELADGVFDLTPPKSHWPALFLLLGWLYWRICVYKLHQYIYFRDDSITSITPGQALGYSFIPLYNIYWLFKWSNSIIDGINRKNPPEKLVKSSIAIAILLNGLIVTRIDPALSLFLIFLIGNYFVHWVNYYFVSLVVDKPVGMKK